jgi:hypothetical protein
MYWCDAVCFLNPPPKWRETMCGARQSSPVQTQTCMLQIRERTHAPGREAGGKRSCSGVNDGV